MLLKCSEDVITLPRHGSGIMRMACVCENQWRLAACPLDKLYSTAGYDWDSLDLGEEID